MLPPLATVEALEEWLGVATLTGTNATRAEAYLAAASGKVRAYTRRAWMTEDDALDSSTPAITADDLDLIAASVVVPAAARKYTNPTDVLQDTTGPFSARFPDSVALGVYLTDDEKAVLNPYRTTARPGLWTQRTTRDDGTGPDTRTIYADVSPSGEPIPFMNRDEPFT